MIILIVANLLRLLGLTVLVILSHKTIRPNSLSPNSQVASINYLYQSPERVTQQLERTEDGIYSFETLQMILEHVAVKPEQCVNLWLATMPERHPSIGS